MQIARLSTNAETGRRPAPRSYPLGYSSDEFSRLERQAAFVADLTEDVLRRAGITSGMHVLDVGCGVGDVSLLAADLVGQSGRVLGIDRSAEAIDIAERRATVAGKCYRVRFAQADLDAFATDERFDAVVGRLVLQYLPDPAATLRRLCRHLRPGGIVAFQEMTSSFAGSIPEGAQFLQCKRWILETFRRTGCENDMGGKLLATFVAAGLPAPSMIAAGRAGGGPDSPIYDYLAQVLRSLLPAAERLGIATAADVQIDTLAERLRREAVAMNSCIVLPMLIGAWTRTPAPADPS